MRIALCNRADRIYVRYRRIEKYWTLGTHLNSGWACVHVPRLTLTLSPSHFLNNDRYHTDVYLSRDFSLWLSHDYSLLVLNVCYFLPFLCYGSQPVHTTVAIHFSSTPSSQQRTQSAEKLQTRPVSARYPWYDTHPSLSCLQLCTLQIDDGVRKPYVTENRNGNIYVIRWNWVRREPLSSE